MMHFECTAGWFFYFYLIIKVKKGEVISQNDVTSPIDSYALVLRKEMENDLIKGKNL